MKTLQVKHVPDELHRQLKARAALEGRSLSDYVLDELRTVAARPTMTEWLTATRKLERPADSVPTPAAEILAAERRR